MLTFVYVDDPSSKNEYYYTQANQLEIDAGRVDLHNP
jgi:hypothetical protein